MNKILNHIAQAMLFLLGILSDAFLSFIDFCQNKQGFNAEFGAENLIASPFNKGLLISRYRKLTRRQSYENLLIAGPTGSGKTTRLLIKQLLELKNCSILINDPSGELYAMASGYLSQFFEIKTINFSDSRVSSGYNLLSRIKRPNEVLRLADLLVRATIDKNSSDPFWSLQSKSLISIFIRLVMYQPIEYRNMANVLNVLNHFAANPSKVDSWILATKDEKLILDYKSMVATPEKTLLNIVSSSKSALQLFDDPEIAKTTAHDSIDFEQLRKKPTIIFLHNSISNMKYISTLQGIFFEQLYGNILKRMPDKKELDLFILLEEASSLYVPVLPVAMANTRKYRVGNIICVQSPAQLETMYKTDAQNIVNNCVTKIFLPGLSDLKNLQELEILSGKHIHTDKKGIERVKPLITSDEIRVLPKNRTLILSGNNPIIKGRTSPYYKSRKYKLLAAMPPVQLRGDIPDEQILFMQ